MVCLLTLLGATVLPPSARAAAPAASAEALSAEARRHYEEGTKAFNLAEFPRAVAEFKAAYNAKPDPLLLYNIGQAFRLGGDEAQALFFYKSFLRNMPDAPNRKEVEVRIRTLDKAVAEQQKQAEQQRKESGITAAAPATSTVPGVGATSPPAVESVVSATVPPHAPAPGSSSAGSAGPSGGLGVVTPLTGLLTGLPPGPTAPSPDHQKGAGVALTPSAPATGGGPARSSLVPPPLATGPNSPAAATSAALSLGVPGPGAAREVDGSSSPPVYRRAWFWVAVGALVVVTIAVAANVDKQPSTTLGLYNPTFK